MLTEEVASRIGKGGAGASSNHSSPFIEIQGNANGKLTDLRIIVAAPAHKENEVYIAYAAVKEAPNESTLDQYESAVAAARSRIERNAPSISWSAIIGQVPSSLDKKSFRLTEGARIENMVLSSDAGLMIEAVQSRPLSLTRFAMAETYPIKVKGKSVGYTWEGASINAAKDLNLLTSLLSTIWCQLVDVREVPEMIAHGERSTPRHPAWSGSALFDREEWPWEVDERGIREVTLPDYASAAWKKLKKEKKLPLALDSFKEGLRCESTSPSLALICFIASIESISQKIFKTNKCKTCEGRRFISSKFKRTLDLVVKDERTKNLLGSAYNLRSRTVHDGKLHGIETTPLNPRSSFFESNSELAFQWQTVSQMKLAAQKLLVLALNSELPPRRTFSPE